MNTNDNTLDQIAEMAGRLTGDASMSDAVRKEAGNSALCNDLAQMRVKAGLSQRALAKRMGVSASKVCRIESGPDSDLSLGELSRYARALDCGITLGVNRPNQTAAEQIKEHIFAVHRLLGELAELAKSVGAGDQIAQGIHKFYGEVLFNFLVRFGESAEKLPRVKLESSGGDRPDGADASTAVSPARARKRSKLAFA